MRRDNRWVFAALIVAGLAAGTLHSFWRAAGAAELATLEDVDGSNLKGIVLSSMAAKRLGIETGTVREEKVRRWLMVNSEVEAMEDGREYALTVPDMENTASINAPDDPVVSVRVRVPVRDTEESAGKAMAGVSLAGGQDDGDEIDAMDEAANIGEEGIAAAIVFPTGGPYGKVWFKARAMSPGPGDGDGTYFAVDNNESGLRPGQRVIVRITQADSGSLQKIIPYSAVIYDVQGNTWVYVNPQPLVFVRHPVTVEQVDRNLAILTDGPALGARIATVGAAELMGIERQLAH
jgi:hypothetical protein